MAIAAVKIDCKSDADLSIGEGVNIVEEPVVEGVFKQAVGTQ